MSNTPPIDSERSIDLYTPFRVAFYPITKLVKTVDGVFHFFIGYLCRIPVFSYAEWGRSTFKRMIINVYKGGCYDTTKRARFDPKRLERAREAMETIGGIRTFVPSKDGTPLDTMLLRYKDVVKTIRDHGGKIHSAIPITIQDVRKSGRTITTFAREKEPSEGAGDYVDLILRDPNSYASEEIWKSFSKETLDRLGLEKIRLTRTNGQEVEGYITKHWESKNPLRPKSSQLTIHCNPPTMCYAMRKRESLRELFATRGDILSFDYRANAESGGNPSEGGYYIDAQAIVEKAVYDYGYNFPDIWVSGFCLGGGVVAHVKRKYHDHGINIAVQNTFNRMANTFNHNTFLAKYGLDAIKSWDPEVTARVEEDCFDSESKLLQIHRDGRGKKGSTYIVNTTSDRTIDPNSHYDLCSAAYDVSENIERYFFKPHQGGDGHSIDVFNAAGYSGDRRVWDHYINFRARVHPEPKGRLWQLATSFVG